jgi:two-component system cell cycle sensor histidine kinase/response regulator CckA
MGERFDTMDYSHARPYWGLRLIRFIAIGFMVVGLALIIIQHFTLPKDDDILLLSLAAVLLLILLAILVWRFKRRDDETAKVITARISETASEGFLVVERDNGGVLYANKAYLTLAGIEKNQTILGVERAFALAPEAAQPIYRLSKLAQAGQEGQEDVRLINGLNASGPTWYRIRTAPMPSTSRQKLILWSISDITRERERQENVFQELQYAIDYLDHAPAGFLSLTPEGDIVYLNATLAQWLGYDLADFVSANLKWSDLVTSNGQALLSLKRGRPGDTDTEIFDLDFRTATERLIPVRIIHQIVFDSSGHPGASRTLVLNRSSDLPTDEGQRIAEVRFARFFNNSPFGIATVNAEGKILRMNSSFIRLLPKDDLVTEGKANHSLWSIVPASEQSAVRSRLALAIEGKGDLPPLDLQLALNNRSARIYVVYFQGASQDSEEAIVYVLDTTDQRALEAQFAQAQKMQAVGELAGGVAHDFNNVLQGILGYADLLLANHRPTDPSFQDIMQIKQNANRAAGLVRHLLAFSRRQTLRPVIVQFTDVLSDLSTLLKRLLGQHIELEVRHERELWTVKADPTQFEQVIVNLAVNARDAMPKGGHLKIKTSNVTATASRSLGDSTIPPADYVMVEIIDTGEGINPDILDKIFEPFFTTKEVGKGTGLGLSMVYGFVKQSGGYILCDSTLGQGTRFRILLPRHIATEAVVQQAEESVVQKPVIVDLSGQGTVLLVEDEDAVRTFGARALAQRGYKVLEAASGIEALEVLEENDGQVDLIVSDVVMPEMDGPSFLREARAKGITAKIIFVSGYAEEAFSKNLPEGEEFGFLPKPFSLKQLIETVKTALG